MLKPEINDQTILDFAQGGYLSIAVDSFITDRRASGLTKHSIKFYQSYLKAFLDYCDSLAVTQIEQINPDFLRKYLHSLGSFRALLPFFHWLDFDVYYRQEQPMSYVRTRTAMQNLHGVEIS